MPNPSLEKPGPVGKYCRDLGKALQLSSIWKHPSSQLPSHCFHTTRTASTLQATMQFYRDQGMVPNVSVFNSSSPEILRLLFEYRPPDSQV